MTEYRKGPRRSRADRRRSLKLHLPERRSGVERRQIDDRRLPGRILVVESEPVFSDLLCHVIEDAGHEVRRAVTRTDLLAELLEWMVEVAVLVVPPLDVLDLLLDGHPETQIVALVLDAEAASDRLGSAVALQEPFTEEKIRAALRIALRNGRQEYLGDTPA